MKKTKNLKKIVLKITMSMTMFTWDESTPKTLSASSTNQLKVSLGVRATTLRTIEVFTKSSRWTSPNIGMITVRGK